MGAEKQTPTSFSFPQSYLIINAELGSLRGNIIIIVAYEKKVFIAIAGHHDGCNAEFKYVFMW